ncbi:MAG: translation initiation factor IF-1A [Candidatus Huberarchaeum crystalense]|uniref:Translation initiation factor 1A n=1 Tax=Huberarchaeum crystalense TaxID=2014257 RepID=A0A2G9LJK8_HUBC1|nr:translation initiation factor IF-1A [archaeon]OIP20248.1 MAG: hypothetical protein AUJ91_01830 [archaeon CG2_30_31_98]PIN66652.1 MAG: translation initiation factor IF-1A [Candidatus Huberarchaeum crystalense]NCS98262.1 translation initiation factor IF-1A [archaeon]PIV13744.1 MAG: translation initiation factor IF-1A [Candidatus Huberarchaeum crystalense]
MKRKQQHKPIKHNASAEQPQFLRLPKSNEVLGIVIQRLANKHFYVKCSDGKVRLCRMPGSFKFKKMWVRENSIVIVEIPPIQGNIKGEIVYSYNDVGKSKLEERKLLDFVNLL